MVSREIQVNSLSLDHIHIVATEDRMGFCSEELAKLGIAIDARGWCGHCKYLRDGTNEKETAEGTLCDIVVYVMRALQVALYVAND